MDLTPNSFFKIKQEPGTPKSERLMSFKMPRDLTLGGGKTRGAPKKVYTPNLNAVRNKNTDVKTARDTSSRGRGGRGERGKGDRGRNKTRGSTLVQSAGLFSEGAAGGNILRRSSSGGNYGSASDAASIQQLRKPTISKREKKIDPEDELKHIHDIMGDEDEDDMDDKADFSKTMPIVLTDLKTEMDNHLSDFKIKTETDTITDYYGYPETLDEFFNRRQSQIFLLQLPDSLPGRGPEIEPAESAEFERSITPDPTANFCTVKQLEEGLIGKILRYKSGKTKLVLGDSRFDINLGMEPGFLQELMSINTNSEERSGNMINLGQIQAKLNAAPDWEFIFKKTT